MPGPGGGGGWGGKGGDGHPLPTGPHRVNRSGEGDDKGLLSVLCKALPQINKKINGLVEQ